MIWPLTHSAEVVLNADNQKQGFHLGFNKDFTAVVGQLELSAYFNTRDNTMSYSHQRQSLSVLASLDENRAQTKLQPIAETPS